MTPQDQKVIDDIAKYGCHVVQVIADEELPQFAFTIGLYANFHHSEIIIVGLDLDKAHILLNDIGDMVAHGSVFEEGKESSEILKDFNCKFSTVTADWYGPLLGYARWYYQGNNFPVLQMLWPDKEGNFPDSENFSQDLIKYQPVLSKPKIK